jgi:hypothetical protein
MDHTLQNGGGLYRTDTFEVDLGNGGGTRHGTTLIPACDEFDLLYKITFVPQLSSL